IPNNVTFFFDGSPVGSFNYRVVVGPNLTINSGGTGILEADNALPTNLNLIDNGTLDLTGPNIVGNPVGFDQTISTLNGSGVVAGTLGGTLTVTGSGSFGGSFTGAAGLVKNGTGTLALLGASSSNTGGLTVNAGVVSFGNDGALGAPSNVITVQPA